MQMCVTDFDISPNSIYQQQEQHVLVTVSVLMDLTITYKYQSPISNDINILCCVCFNFVALDVSLGFHFLLRVCYVNPAYGCQIEIKCIHLYLYFVLNVLCVTSVTVRDPRHAIVMHSFVINVCAPFLYISSPCQAVMLILTQSFSYKLM